MSDSVDSRADAVQPAGGQPHRFDLTSATALIVGTIIGVRR
jgi:hypothetical protein